MRTIIELPNDQLDALEGICRRDRISRAEAIRRAVALLVQQRNAGEHDAFGLWRTRGVDGLAYQRRLRAEWRAPASPRRRR
jgi:metal-responsive CopG/Arc/MetJ family transcriptional regulator